MQIWHLVTMECGAATVNFAADLERHQRAVNVVRFSPSKEILASGDDGWLLTNLFIIVLMLIISTNLTH